MTVANTIDHVTLLHQVTAGSVIGAQVIGQPGGWGVIVQDGTAERVLTAKRGSARVFRKFETLAGYLKEVGIPRFAVDASQFDAPAIPDERKRADAADRLKSAHEAAAHDRWFREQVQAGLNDRRPTVPHDAAMAELRAEIERVAHRGAAGAD